MVIKYDTRYYVHGDRIEVKEKLYYCSRCDGFLAEGHFSNCLRKGNDDDISRYYRGLRNLKVLKKKGFYRLKEAENIFI